MPLRTSFPVAEKGNTIPYPPLFDSIRKNFGYVELRGNPELVMEIPEAAESPALRSLIQYLAHHESPFFSLGCDLGQHVEKKRSLSKRKVSGGYLQFACASISDDNDIGKLRDISFKLKSALEEDVSEDYWEVKFELSAVRFEISDRVDTHSTWIWFYAASSSFDKSSLSRERLLNSILRGFQSQ